MPERERAEDGLAGRALAGRRSAVTAVVPRFDSVRSHAAPLEAGVAGEVEWMRAAAGGQPTAHLWSSPRALVVPRSYQRAPRWQEACAESAAAGWPVRVRSSGGGLVPQGPGVLNLSLVWPAPSPVPSATDTIYRAVCGNLAAALARLGIFAEAQPVVGSFCDGRFNLAVRGRKLAGTAQSWRRIDGTPVVLAHAVLLVDADPCVLTDGCNAFEAMLGHEHRYRAEAITTIAEAWADAHDAGRADAHDSGWAKAPAAARAVPDLPARLRASIAEQFAPQASDSGSLVALR